MNLKEKLKKTVDFVSKPRNANNLAALALALISAIGLTVENPTNNLLSIASSLTGLAIEYNNYYHLRTGIIEQ